MKKPTLKAAVLAHCHQCMGYWSDGVVDCKDYRCPLYSWQIRADKEKADLSWMQFNPRRVGQVTHEESKREMSEEQRAAAAERLRQAREKNDRGW